MKKECALMFSGGRDSTLAAIRLYEQGLKVHLLTVSNDHLVGIQAVKNRLRELAKILPSRTSWTHIAQPVDLKTDVNFYKKTCLPCHHAYVTVGVSYAITKKFGKLAFGYAGYQSHWPEQTQYAIDNLRELLKNRGIDLILPTYDLISRGSAVEQLEGFGMSGDSFEQKCLNQVQNIELSPELLKEQVDKWRAAIEASLSSIATIKIEVLSQTQLGSV